MRYSDHEALIAPARPHSELWRTLLGIVLIAMTAISTATVVMWVVASVSSGIWYSDFMADLQAGNTPRATLWALFGFSFLIFGIALVTRILNKRSMQTLIGPLKPAITDFCRVFAILATLYIVITFIPSATGSEPQPNLEFSRWILILPISILAVFIQVSAEELLFRGYIQSQLAARFANPLIWMIAPSLIFALGHFSPEIQGDNAWIIVIWAAIFGIIASDLTARSGNLGAAIALHFINNASAILLTAPMGPLSGLALYTFDFDLTDVEAVRAALPLDFAMMLLGWLAARIAIRA